MSACLAEAIVNNKQDIDTILNRLNPPIHTACVAMQLDASDRTMMLPESDRSS